MPRSSPRPPMVCLPGIPALAAWLWLSVAAAGAATITPGDVTATLGPSFFVDDAVNGGGDADLHEPVVASYHRSFAGLLTRNQGPARVSITGFGFAAHTSASANDATSVAVTFTYLGADELLGGGDDVVIGTATGTYGFAGGGEYAFAFDAPLTADLDLTGTRFRIQLAPANATGNGSLKIKTGALTHETATGPKFSVAGFVVPQRVNLAKYQPVTADSVAGQRLASYVTDGDAGDDNRWESSGSAPHWARVDFPFPVQVGSARVFTGFEGANAQQNFSVQYLNGGSWVDAPGAGVAGNTDVERKLVFTTPVTAASFRVHSPDGTLRLRELALYPPKGGAGFPAGTDVELNLARQRPALASTHTSGSPALLAVDGRVNQDSSWQTTAAGLQSLEIDLIAGATIGGTHLYSGAPGIAPLADFVLKSWDGAAWQDIPGGSVTGNTTADLALSFATPVTTSRVRLEFANPGTTVVRELCVFAANDGNAGYPPGTGVIGAPPSAATADDFTDSFHQIRNPSAGRSITIGNGDRPALEDADPDPARGHYQILFNLGTGTWRLRNRATGNCLSGAGLSSSPGLPLTDEPYTALPHQDWILDPLDGGAFQILNQWSGLALDLQGGATAAGTPLVQSPADGSPSQRWIPVHAAGFPKKGVGGNHYANAFDARWMYNWGLATSAILPAGAVHQPMQWGNYNWTYGTTANSTWKLRAAWRASGQPLHLLGFNEPDAWSQSGRSLDLEDTGEADFSPTRSVTTAVALWPRLMAMDLPLVSPAPASMNGGWLADFYTRADALGYRVDYTAIHTYPGPNGGSSNNLVATIENAYNNWGRPVWLTEFSFVSWNGNGTWTEEDNYNCLAEFLWRAESLPWLRKYALFVFTEDAGHPQPAEPWSAVGPRSNSRDLNGKLTAFGRLYAAWDNEATVRNGTSYFIHNKDTRKRLASVAGPSAPDARSIRIDDPLVRWTLAAAPVAGRHYLVSSLDGRRLSFVDGGSVTLAAADATGPAVQWALTESQHGWFFVEHPASSKRLKLQYDNATATATFSMVSNTNTGDPIQWRFIVTLPPPSWTGGSDDSWTNAGNWNPGAVPAGGDPVAFDENSLANLDTMLDQDFDLPGLRVTQPAGPVSIGGTHRLTLASAGIDMAASTRDLTILAPLALGAAQSWTVAGGRTLGIPGAVSGAADLTIAGAGRVALGDLVVAGTLDLAGAATVHLDPGAALAFADSSAVDWTGGSLNLTGTFVPGASLRFGTDENGLAPAQLALVTVNGGGGPFILDGAGYLATAPTGFAAWQSANGTTGGFGDDHDGDRVPNGIEYFLAGGTASTGFTALPGLIRSEGAYSVIWTHAADYTGSYGTDFVVETSATLAAGSWTPETAGGNVTLSGDDVKFTFPSGTRIFVRLTLTGP